MGRGVDISALSRGERLVLAGGVLLFANAFIPWWFRIETPERTYWANAGLTGFSVAAALIGFAIAVAVLVRAARYPRRGPADGLAYTLLGGLALGALLLDSARRVAWVGAYIAIGLAVFIIWAGFVRRAERRRGWI